VKEKMRRLGLYQTRGRPPRKRKRLNKAMVTLIEEMLNFKVDCKHIALITGIPVFQIKEEVMNYEKERGPF